MAKEQLEWINITDFRPGIFDVVSPRNPIGSATRANTYRCIANNNGALEPLPRRKSSITLPNPGAPGDDLYFIGGMRCVDPLFDGTSDKAEEGNNTGVFVGVEWFEGNVRHLDIWRRNEFRNPANWKLIKSVTESRPGLYDANYRPARAQFETTRSNHADTNTAGTPIVIMLYGDSPIFHAYPKDSTPGSDTTDPLPKPPAGFPQPSLFVCHQGRVVAMPLTLYGAGVNTVYPTNEGIYWTAVNDYHITDPLIVGGFFNVVFGYENPTGYQFGASLTANELLLMKSKGGGIALSGDLNNPTATNLPHVMSPGHSNAFGTQSPLGYVYPVQNDGMWVWGGGDQSELISAQLSPNFWKPELDVGAYGRPAVTMCLWRQWVMAPHNWLFDTQSKGWWRLADDDEVDTFHLDTDWTGQFLYATPHRFEQDADDPVLYKWDKKLGANSYSWQSHPVLAPSDRRTEVSQVVLVASGHGTVNVIVMGSNGDTDTDTVTVDSDTPVLFRRNMRTTGFNIQLRLIAHSNESSGDAGAPTVHEARIGVQPRQRAGVLEGE